MKRSFFSAINLRRARFDRKKPTTLKVLKFYIWGAALSVLMIGLLSWTGLGSAQGNNTLTGTVTDGAGNPVQFNYVDLNATDGNTGSTYTNSSGNYSEPVTPDVYSVYIHNTNPVDNYMDQYYLRPSGMIDLTNGDVTQDFKLDTANIHVTVKNASGTTISGATVTAYDYGGGTTYLYPGDPGTAISGVYSGFNGRAVTGSDGTVNLTTLVGAQFGTTYSGGSICANISGSQVCLTAPLTITGNTSIVLQAAPSTHTLSGTVTDSTGSPIQFNYVDLNASDGNTSSTYTNSTGTYSQAATPDIYNLYIHNDNPVDNYLDQYYLRPSGTVDLTSSDVTQNFKIDTANLHVTVKDASGTVVSGATVTAYDYGGGTTSLYPGDPGTAISGIYSGFNGRAVTGADGTVNLTTIVGAEYGTTYSGGSICANVSGSEVCMAAPLTITGDTNVVIQPISAAPTTLTAPSPTNQAPVLSWTASPGAASYNIYRDGAKIGSSTSPAYTDSGATQGTHSYYVTAVNAGGESGGSNTVSVILDTTTPVVTITPVAGSTLSGTVIFNITVSDNNPLDPTKNTSVWVYLYDTSGTQKSWGAKVNLSSGSGTFTIDTTKINNGNANLDVGKVYDAADNPSGRTDTYFKNYTVDN